MRFGSPGLELDEIFDVLPQNRLFPLQDLTCGKKHTCEPVTCVIGLSNIAVIPSLCWYYQHKSTLITTIMDINGMIYSIIIHYNQPWDITTAIEEDLVLNYGGPAASPKNLWRRAVSPEFSPNFQACTGTLSTLRLRGAMMAWLIFISFSSIVMVSGWTCCDHKFKWDPTLGCHQVVLWKVSNVCHQGMSFPQDVYYSQNVWQEMAMETIFDKSQALHLGSVCQNNHKQRRIGLHSCALFLPEYLTWLQLLEEKVSPVSGLMMLIPI